ncbi:MAG: hypothetical protein JXR88_16010 [Clostridia bacterium]|nr:hypothetical protein [Clostridia bacterium]
MSEFNNDSYIKDQIRKQYGAPKTSTVKVTLKEKLYDIDMEKLNNLLFEKDIEAIQLAVKNKEVTYGEIMRYYWNRCVQFKSYNSILTLNPKCVEKADDMTYSDSHHMIYGLPVVLKDNIGTKDLPTTAGAAILKSYACDEDSEIVKKIESKGGIILGKSNLSEWANFMSTESSNGYSAVGGQTKNPYGEFDVGGSSAGSAVVAALNLCPLTVGSETAGSIIYPSSQNCVVGLKPTLGLVSQDRIIPISKTHDTAGPMTKHVKDAYYLLSAMTSEILEPLKNQLKGKKMGIINNEGIKPLYREEDEVLLGKVLEDISQVAEISYCEIEEKAFETQVYDILKYEFKFGIKDYFESFGKEGLTLNEIIAFNETNMSDFAPYNHEIILQAATEDFDEMLLEDQIIKNRTVTQEALDELFETYDCLVTLSNYLTSVYAPAGYPAVTVPSGFRNNGEPIGVTFIGKRGEDVKLMNIALGYETLTKHRQPPEVRL